MESSREFSGLVERYTPAVFAAAYRATGDRALSEELVQETFLRAWRKLPELAEPPALPGWLCGIARNLAQNARRRRREEAVEAAEPMATSPSPLEDMLVREREAAVRAALERVPSGYREPLELFYRADQSVDSVAEALGLSAGTVRQRLSRGRKRLRELVASMVVAVVAVVARVARAVPAMAGGMAPVVAVAVIVAQVIVAPVATGNGDENLVRAAVVTKDDAVHERRQETGIGTGDRRQATGDRRQAMVSGSGSRSGSQVQRSATLERALAFYRRGDYFAASIAFEQVASGDRSGDRQLAQLYLARTLVKLGLNAAALDILDAIARDAGHRFRQDALALLAPVSRALPDPSAPAAIAGLVTPDEIDRTRARGDLHYLAGRHHYARDPRRALRHFDAVPSGSSRFLEARLMAGVVHVRLGAATAAVRAFETVLARAGERDRDLRELALLDLARVHYSTGRYRRAVDTLERMPRRSRHWPTAVFEATWAYFRRGDAARGLGHLHTLRAPSFADHPFAEAIKVEAAFYLTSCHFRRAMTSVAEFERRFGPAVQDLRALVARAPGDDAAYFRLAVSWRRARGRAARALDDADTDRVFDQVTALDRELGRLAAADPAWRSTRVAVTALQSLTVQRDLSAQAAGRHARARITRHLDELVELRGDMRRIRIELLELQAANRGRPFPADSAIEIYAIDDQASYWPWDGAYWRDELGRYYARIRSQCPVKAGRAR